MPRGRNADGEGVGRPRIEFKPEDWKRIEQLCAIQCTAVEIGAVMGCSPDTIERRVIEMGFPSFADYIKKHAAGGKASLRRSQFALAQKSAAMAIWLGKQYLGQREPKMNDTGDIEDSDAIYAAALNAVPDDALPETPEELK